MKSWRKIETAPKDGTSILVYNKDGHIYEAKWDTRLGIWRFAVAEQHGCGCCGGNAEFPTHWMPLPEPPSRGERGWQF